MSKKTFKSWWILLIRGILILLFGVFVLIQVNAGLDNPIESLINLSIYLGILIFITGVLNIVGALNQGGPRDNWNWLLSEGMLDLLIGVLIMTYPFRTGPIVLLLSGIWVLSGSIIQITNALINKEHLRNWKVTIVSGIISLILVFLYLNSSLEESATMVFYLYGTMMIIFGLMYTVISFSIKGMTVREVREIRSDAMKADAEYKGISKSK